MEVKKGNKVKVDYEGKFENGEVFDSSKQGENARPIEFIAGAGMVVPGFDKAVLGMKKREEKEFKVTPEEGYGQPDPKLTREIPREVLPKEQEPKAGMMIVMGMPNGHQIPAKIKSVQEKTVTLDLNHPLAGKTLVFNIKVVEVSEVKAEVAKEAKK